MQTKQILNHIPGTSYNHLHFFIQSTGYNAGRPSAQPYTNSHVVLCDSELEKGMLFWICFGLWKSNGFLPLLKGYHLDAEQAAKLIDSTCQKLSSHPSEFISNVKELKELIHTEKLLNIQLRIIKQIKKSISRKMLGRS